MAIYVTESGKNKIEAKILELTREIGNIREEKAIAYTTSGDTWHDNPGFNRLEQMEHQVAGEIAKLQTMLSGAIVIPVDRRNTMKVSIGSIVRFVQTSAIPALSGIRICEIVGFGESDFETQKIAYDTPIGRALIGLRPDEKGEAKLPRGVVGIHVEALFENWADAKQTSEHPAAWM